MKILSQEATMRAFDLAQRTYKPKQISDLKEDIENKIKLAEMRMILSGGVIDRALVNEIVFMKLKLDGLYCDWSEGKIE